MNEFDKAKQATIRLIQNRQERHATLTQKMVSFGRTREHVRIESALARCLEAIKEHLDD